MELLFELTTLDETEKSSSICTFSNMDNFTSHGYFCLVHVQIMDIIIKVNRDVNERRTSFDDIRKEVESQQSMQILETTGV